MNKCRTNLKRNKWNSDQFAIGRGWWLATVPASLIQVEAKQDDFGFYVRAYLVIPVEYGRKRELEFVGYLEQKEADELTPNF